MSNQLLTFDEAGEILKISRRQVARLVDAGTIPVLKLGPRTRRIPAGKLDAYIEGNTKCQSAKGVRRGSSMSKSAKKELDRLLGGQSRTRKNGKPKSANISYLSERRSTD